MTSLKCLISSSSSNTYQCFTLSRTEGLYLTSILYMSSGFCGGLKLLETIAKELAIRFPTLGKDWTLKDEKKFSITYQTSFL